MSAIAKSTVSTVPSATACLNSSTVTPRTLRSRSRRAGSDLWRRAYLFLNVDLAHLPGEVLARGRHPADPGKQDHDPDRERRVVERLPIEFVVPGDRFRGERQAE